jgi:hypothetical protein
MCSKTRSLSQKCDTALHAALHAVLHAELHAFSMSFSLSNLFFDLSTQKPTNFSLLNNQDGHQGGEFTKWLSGLRGRLHMQFSVRIGS